jgi:uncharacterized protein YegP (UPF0339 family)
MPKCEIYKDVKGEWRWRRVTKDGEIKAYSETGFEEKEKCEEDGKKHGGCSSYKRV